MAKETPEAKQRRLRREELDRLAGEALPNRENMSLLSLGGSGVLGGLADPLDPGATPDPGGDVPTGTDGTADPGGADATPTGIAGTIAGLAGAAANEASTDADGSTTVGEDGTVSSHDEASSQT
jgi:hypothetical protein